MAVRPPQDVHPAVVDLIQNLVGNSPDKMLPAHQRYALSVIADGQGQRTQSDEFTKAAGQGVSPEAFAATRAADQMAASIGINPPPEPPAPVADANAATTNPYFKDSPTAGAMPQGGIAAGQPPPGTYYDVDRRMSVYDPNYHGPYQPIHGMSKGGDANEAKGNPIDMRSATGAGVPVATETGSTTTANSTSSPANTGAGATITTGTSGTPQKPMHQYATIDQQRIDDAWNKFDQAMAAMPHPPDPAELPEIGLAQVITMAAAGLIDPMAGAVIGKALFDAPVMAKQLIDQERDKTYADSVKMWQNNTQRTLQAAQNVERSEVNKQHNQQTSYDKNFDTESDTYNTSLRTRSSNLRKILGTVSDQIKVATTMLTKPLSASEKQQWTDHLNALYQHQNALQSDIMGVEQGGQSEFFTSDGKPTPAYTKMQSDINLTDQKINESKAHENLFIERTGLTAEQANKLRVMLPHEVARMDAQTGNYNANTVRAIYGAMESAERIRNYGFQRELQTDRFRLDVVKAQAGELDKVLAAKRAEYKTAQTTASKEQGMADKLMGDPTKYANGKWIDPGAEAAYNRHVKAAQTAQTEADGLGGAGGTIDRLAEDADTLRTAISQTEAPNPQAGSSPSYGDVSKQANTAPSKIEAFISAANDRIGKPYKWGGGRDKGPDSSMDCSGLVCDAAEAAGVPSPGSTAEEQRQNVPSVNGPPMRGDLIFFDWNGDGKADHVGIYLGGKNFIEASSSSGKVKESLLDQKHTDHVIKIGRMNFRDGGQPVTAPAATAPAARPSRGSAAKAKPAQAPVKEAHYGDQDMSK